MTSIGNWANLVAVLLVTVLLGGCNSSATSAGAAAVQSQSYTGHALLGPLVNAKVEVYSLADIDGDPVFSTETHDSENLDEAGQFSIPASALKDDNLYVVKVSGGQDVDADDDGVRDGTPTENKGAIHALLTTDQIRRGDYNISILTEVLYRRLAYLLSAGYSKEDIVSELNYRASIALKSDINGDGVVNDDDAVAWQPRLNQAALRHGFSSYRHLQASVHAGAAIGSDAYLRTGGEIARLDLGGMAALSNMAMGNGVAGYIGGTGPATYSLSVLDISDPLRPRKAGTLGVDSARAIAAQGDFFYVPGNSALDIIDAGNPDAPVETGSLMLASPSGIAVNGDFAYLSTSGAGCGVVVVDVSQPTAPQLKGSAACSGIPGVIAYHNNALYTVLDKNRIQIFDVSRPDSPAPAGVLDIKADGAILFDGTTAYVMDAASRLNIIDVSDIHNPLIIKTMGMAVGQLAGIEADTLFFDAGDAIQAYDVSEPNRPVLSAQFPGSPSHHSGTQLFKDGLYYELGPNLLSISDLHILERAPPLKVLAHTDMPNSTAFDIAVKDNVAYVPGAMESDLSGYLNGVTVVDISDSLAPKVVSRVPTPGYPREATVSGTRLYVSGGLGVAQLDSTTPSHPVVAGDAGRGFGARLALKGGRLYSASWETIGILDTSQVHNVSSIGALYHQSQNFTDISVNDAGNIACTVDADDHLQFVDVSGSVPVLLKTLTTDAMPYSCRFHGDFVFVTTSDEVEVVDAGAPGSAAVVDRIAIKTTSPVIFNGNIAYVSDGDHLKIYVYDVSNPSSPVLKNIASGYLGKYAVVQNNKIYTRGQNPYYFVILDISNPLDPSFMGSTTGFGEVIYPFAVSGTVAYLLTYDINSQQKTLQVLDVSNPALPVTISSLPVPDPPGVDGIGLPTPPASLVANKNTLYIAGWDTGIQMVDVSDPRNPRIAGARYYPIFILADVAAKGPYAFVADSVLGLHVFDFTDPSSPAYYDVSGSEGTPDALAVDGNILYAVSNDTFEAVDISDPAKAKVMGSVAVNLGSAGFPAIAVKSDIAYVRGWDKLITINVSDPAHPTIAGPSVSLVYYGTVAAERMPVLDNKLYIARGASGIEVVDISNPSHPYTAGVIPIPAMAAAVKGGYLYSVGENGLDVVAPMNHSLP